METMTQEPQGESVAVITARLGHAWTQSRAMGLFLQQGDRLWLEVSDGLQQAALEYVARVWRTPPPAFQRGTAHFDSGTSSGGPSIVVPCVVESRVCGLLYLETVAATRIPGAVLHALGKILGAAIGSSTLPAADMIAWTEMTDQEAQAANLWALMERHEWNVARVARELGVTRMTVYNRLRRHRVPRHKVRRGRLRTQRRSS